MDFAPTTLFVVPVGNSVPTTGSTEDLTAGQFGIFKGKYRDVATAGNVALAPYIQLGQGRPGTGLGTKISARINADRVTEWYKIVGHPTASVEIWDVSNLVAKVGTQLHLTVRIHSTFADATSYNGITQSVTVDTGCLDCGTAPCTEVANETLVDAILAKIDETLAAQDSVGNSLRLDSYVTYSKVGTGASAKIRITGKAPQQLAFVEADLNTRNIDKDRIWFRPFIFTSTDTTVDFQTFDNCDVAGDTTLVQRSNFKSGGSEEIKQMEVDFYSYQARFKHLFRNSGYNGEFQSYVTDGTTYDLYFIRFGEMNPDSDVFAPNFPIDWRVIIAVPQGETTSIEDILEAYLGAATDDSGAVVNTPVATHYLP